MKGFSTRRLFLGLAFMGGGVAAVPTVRADQDTLTLRSLEGSLRQSQGSWTAGATTKSQLTYSERLSLGGVLDGDASRDSFIVLEDAPQDQSPDDAASIAALPTRWDWRSVDGRSFLGPVLDQGVCGSCVSFAALDTLEARLNVLRNTSPTATRLSRQYAFSCSGGVCRTGIEISRALTFLKEAGVPDEVCMPYESGALGADVDCARACSDASRRSLRISSVDHPTDGAIDVLAIKKALRRGPLMSSMILYEDLLFYRSGVYRHTAGRNLGSHAVTLVGWNDDEQSWIVRNSWGPDWGEGGYFRVAWNEGSLVGRYTYSIEASPDGEGFVAFSQPLVSDVLTGVVPMSIRSTLRGTTRVEWHLARNLDEVVAERAPIRRQLVRSADAMTNFDREWSPSDHLDTRGVADGEYVLVARAFHSSGVAESHPVRVYVLNGTQTGTIAFGNLREGQSVMGTRRINLAVEAAPVPFSQIRFLARHLNSGTQIVRTTTNVAASMSLQWATQGIADGAYEVQMEGITTGVVMARTPAVRVSVVNGTPPISQ